MKEIIDSCFKETGWLDEKHKGILNFKAHSSGAWADVKKIRELYELIMKRIDAELGEGEK